MAGHHFLQSACQGAPENRAGDTVEAFLEVPVAWAFGLAALWLLAPYVNSRARVRTFLGSLGVLAAFMALSYAARVGWGMGTEPVMSLLDPRHCSATASPGLLALPVLAAVVLPAPVVAAALLLCGLACRGRYRPFALWPWLIASLLAVWLAVSALLYAWYGVATPWMPGYRPFLALGLLMAVVTLAALLPYLILAAASRFFRGRLKGLLHVETKEPPRMAPAQIAGRV